MTRSGIFTEEFPLTIIGAGPIGLAAAAKSVARGIPFRLLEAGESAASAVKAWGHVRLFSPWAECIDEDARALLRSVGWSPPPDDTFPDGNALINDYLSPLSKLPDIKEKTRYGTCVAHVQRLKRMDEAGFPRFRIVTRLGEELVSGATIDASGTWGNPRRVPRSGPKISARVHCRVPDVGSPSMVKKLAGRRVAIIGSGHSGMTLLIELIKSGVAGTVIWVRRGAIVRSGAPIGPGSARVKLEEKAEEVASHPSVQVLNEVTVDHLRETRAAVEVHGRAADGTRVDFEADYVFAPLGFHPDHSIARDLRLAIDPDLAAPQALAELIDPERHSCNSVPVHGWQELAHPESGFFIAGSKSYGRAPNFALTTGYRQITSILDYLVVCGASAGETGSPTSKPDSTRCV